MARAIIDKQTMYVFAVATGFFALFFYGVTLAHEDSMNFIDEVDTNIEGTSYDSSGYEPKTSGEILTVHRNNLTIGDNMTIPDITIPELTIPEMTFKIFGWDGSGITVEPFTVWNETTVMSQTTIFDGYVMDLSFDVPFWNLTLHFNRFGGDGMFPNAFGDYGNLKSRLSGVPMVFLYVLAVIPLAITFMIVRAFDISI